MKRNTNFTTQINGIPGKVVGLTVLPIQGSCSLQLVDDFLKTKTQSFFGLEESETLTPVQDVRTIETGEGCTWWLFWIGVITLGIMIGIVFIVLAFVVKQRWLIIYTSRANLVVFNRNKEKIEQFKRGLVEAMLSQNSSKSKVSDSSLKPPTPPRPPVLSKTQL